MVKVVEYSTGAFKDLLKKHSEISDAHLDKKLKSGFFNDYFDKVGVKTIVVEEEYLDHDYLEDFSAYYVKCFNPYRRYCTRLHFFRSAFTEADFSAFLQGENGLTVDSLRLGYAGFLVVKPLPSNIIGRTCLITYGPADGRRHFPSISTQRSNLYGIELSTDTLPFQEQDRVTAACATSALWSAFQATGRMFQHRLPSPVEITRAATSRMPLRSRAFPNTDGLTIEQMAHAIREVGLEPYFVNGQDESIFRKAVYAYVAGGIPALIIFSLSAEISGKRQTLGRHAAAVAGYSIPSPNNPGFIDQQIDKLYVHDDQVGPHARMEFAKTASGEWYLTTSWGLGAHKDVRAHPIAILLPLYHKIRIPFTRASEDILAFDHALRSLGSAVPVVSGPITWDLKLTTVNAIKTGIVTTPSTKGPLREKLLSRQFPRFMWHAAATTAAGLLVDILFDATDIDSGNYICRLDIHEQSLGAVVQHVATGPLDTQVAQEICNIWNKRNKLASA